MMDSYKEAYPDLYQELFKNINDEYAFDEEAFMQEYQDGISEATRVTSEKLINAIAAQNPTFLSGTAD